MPCPSGVHTFGGIQHSKHGTPAPLQTAQAQGRARREKNLCVSGAALLNVWMCTAHLKMLMGQLGLRGGKMNCSLQYTEVHGIFKKLDVLGAANSFQ